VFKIIHCDAPSKALSRPKRDLTSGSGMITTYANVINADILAFIKGPAVKAA